MAGRLSGLTTRGRCFLAGGVATAACSVLLDERDLLRVAVFIGALPLLAVLLAARTHRSVRARREIVPDRLPVDTDAVVRLHCSGGLLLGPIRLADAVPDAVGPRPSTPPRFTLHRLSPRSGTTLDYPIRPAQRGVHRVGPLTGRATDPLGLAEFSREIAPPDRITVLPRIVPLRGLPPALGSGDSTSGAGAPVGHQGQGRTDVLIRPYRHGDDLRRVHWRSTARHDQLMVRLEERPWRGGTTVLLDRRDGAHRGHGPDSSLEYAVSLVASVCAHLVATGERVDLVTEDGADPVGVAGDPGHGTGGRAGLDPVLDALAALRPSARRDLTGPILPSNGGLLAVLGALGPGDAEALLARHPAGGHAVLLDVPTWDPGARPGRSGTASAADALRRAGWHVTVATADRPLGQVWADLVATATSGAGTGWQ